MCHARSPFFISHWSTIMWPVYLKTKQNRSHVIFLPKQWLPKTYTKAANWAWPQCLLPPGPTGVSITESSNSPFQILIKLNSCLLSYNFFICFFFFLLLLFPPFTLTMLKPRQLRWVAGGILANGQVFAHVLSSNLCFLAVRA